MEERKKVPPGQVVTKTFPVLSASRVPEINLENFKFRVFGSVENPYYLTWGELMAMPKVKKSLDIHCLVPGSIVYANPEPVEIENIKVGHKIIGADGLRHKVKRIIKRSYSGKVIGVKSNNLPPVLMTPEHPVMIVKSHKGLGKSKSKRRQKTFLSGYNPKWVNAENLSLGDYVFFPKYKYVSKEKYVKFGTEKFLLDKRLAYILGWYVAEGCSISDRKHVKKHASFALNIKEKDSANKIRQLLAELFDAKTSIYNNKNGTVLKINITSARINVAPMFRNWCGINAHSKKIPDFIINANVEILKTFLLAFFEGDGYSPLYTGKFGIRNNFVDFTTASKILAYQLILALSKLNISGYLVNHPGSVRMGYSVRVHGDSAQKLIEGFPIFNKIDRNRYWETKKGFYYPIKKIWTQDYTGPVYDFEAPGSPGLAMLSPFVTQDCVTHWSRLGDEWEGISLKAIIEKAKPKGKFVMEYANTVGYSTNIPIENALHEDAMLAFNFNGKPLQPDHGGPLRAVIPGLYFWKSAKWIDAVEIMENDRAGFWELRGYNMHGDPWKEERYWDVKESVSTILKRVLNIRQHKGDKEEGTKQQ